MSGVVVTRAERLGHNAPSAARVVTHIAVASVVAGVLMGVLWWLLAPDVHAVVVDGGLGYDSSQAQHLFSRDAVFTLLGGGFGLVLSVVFTVWRRRTPVAVLVSLAAMGVVGSLIARFVGEFLGPDDDVSGLADGVERLFPLQLGSDAALLVWSMVAVVVAAVVALFREDRTPWAPPGV
ncbi:DUF2567 domain-containing protein [Jiangella aurantiaca]|uniref:DUF2567 domain-containing protein n=1 Tax=Jiangella aurantiaca TaxID=2530373 RepID=A0A4V2YSB6_9ACTN|nr:DUF2567 domain-containing protein [Jiangella aurantiaca]TDD69647.1 DUF2567 domain-containing protein [Jiangella aurantiaca]